MSLRHRILEEQGLRRVQGRAKFADGRKTAAMRLLELQTGKTIEVLLAKGTLRQLARRLGVHHTTILKWRRRLQSEDKNSGRAAGSPTA